MKMNIPVEVLAILWSDLQDLGFTGLRSRLRLPPCRWEPKHERVYLECSYAEQLCELDTEPTGTTWNDGTYTAILWLGGCDISDPNDGACCRMGHWRFINGKLLSKRINLKILLDPRG